MRRALFISALLGSAGLMALQAAAADRALLIGLDQYAEGSLSAKSGTPAANDLTAIRLLLTTKLGYGDVNVRTLADGEATRDAILGSFDEWLVGGTKPGERVYLYFSGQGYFTPDKSGEEKDGLDEGLVPFDAKTSTADGQLAIDGLVTDDDIAALLGKLKGRDVTLVVDAGFSGVVTRGENKEAAADQKAPAGAEGTRAIVIEAADPQADAKAETAKVVVAQKSEGGWLDAAPEGEKIAAWSAVSASQTALVDTTDPARIGGVFSRLYIEGLGEGRADGNKNGNVSNAELFGYVTDGSTKYCDEHKASCEMGLTPRLEPSGALADLKPAEPEKIVDGGQAPEPKPSGGGVPGAITVDTVTDFLSKGNTNGISLGQRPDGEVFVGDKDIRFVVTSPHDGFLILLNLSDDGKLIHLYPNQFSRKRDQEGRIRANAPLMVPDDYYGIRFDATEPSTGQIIAIVTRNEIDLNKAVGTRAIEIIPAEEAVQTFLPKIVAAVGEPPATSDPEVNTEPADWSVATMRYVIKPRP